MSLSGIQHAFVLGTALLVALVGRATAQRGGTCSWRWTAPDTLLYHGAPFGFNNEASGHPVRPARSILLAGTQVSFVGDTAGTVEPLLAIAVGADGRLTPLPKPTFLRTNAINISAVQGSAGTTHVLWTSMAGANFRILYSSSDGTRWSVPDTVMPATLELTLSSTVAAVGDDVVVAQPDAAHEPIGITVATRMHGRWDTAHFGVLHSGNVELPLTVWMDRTGASVVYARPASPNGPPVGVYVRRRRFGQSWGPETLVRAGEGFAPLPLTLPDGTVHIFWHGIGADSSVELHAISRDYRTWTYDRLSLPRDIQGIAVSPEDDGIRMIMMQANDPNDMDITESRLLSLAWKSSGYSAIDTLPNAAPRGSPVIFQVAPDTSVVLWDGQRLVTLKTNASGKGPARWQSIVPATILSRHVRVCPAE